MNDHKALIFFRGRSTEGIVVDALRLGLSGEVSIIARDGDRLKQEGDHTPSEAISLINYMVTVDQDWDITVIANGGTSQQLVPVILRLAELAVEQDVLAYQASQFLGNAHFRRWKWRVVEVLPDQVQPLAPLFGGTTE